jgi:hypothetical protein
MEILFEPEPAPALNFAHTGLIPIDKANSVPDPERNLIDLFFKGLRADGRAGRVFLYQIVEFMPHYLRD